MCVCDYDEIRHTVYIRNKKDENYLRYRSIGDGVRRGRGSGSTTGRRKNDLEVCFHPMEQASARCRMANVASPWHSTARESDLVVRPASESRTTRLFTSPSCVASMKPPVLIPRIEPTSAVVLHSAFTSVYSRSAMYVAKRSSSLLQGTNSGEPATAALGRLHEPRLVLVPAGTNSFVRSTTQLLLSSTSCRQVTTETCVLEIERDNGDDDDDDDDDDESKTTR